MHGLMHQQRLHVVAIYFCCNPAVLALARCTLQALACHTSSSGDWLFAVMHHLGTHARGKARAANVAGVLQAQPP
jgi:hypothetical protein